MFHVIFKTILQNIWFHKELWCFMTRHFVNIMFRMSCFVSCVVSVVSRVVCYGCTRKTILFHSLSMLPFIRFDCLLCFNVLRSFRTHYYDSLSCVARCMSCCALGVINIMNAMSRVSWFVSCFASCVMPCYDGISSTSKTLFSQCFSGAAVCLLR